MNLSRKKLWTGGSVLLAVLLLVWAFWPQATEVELGAVSRGPFERAVQEDGKTRLRERYVVSTPLTGRVQRIALKQGDSVARDAVLATLWPVMPGLLDERARQEQNERIGAMEAAVRRASANVERARAALDQAVADLKRSETLAQQGFVSPTQNETGRLTVRLRQKELDSARQEEDATGHELAQARIAIRTFSQGGTTAQRSWAIKSPVTGKVLKVSQQSESLVQAGTPLLELGDPGDLEVVVDLLTEDAAQVKPGTPATLANWGGAQLLQARVRLVEPAAFTKISALGVEEQRVNVVLDILSPREQWNALGDGYKADVRIVVQTEKDALKVPVSALFPSGARAALYAVEGGRARLHEVEVLARNGSEAWVKSELAPGTEVILFPPSSLKDGERVQKLTGG
ncbi:efflux RND transporter periplasmic adaptor subunit [Curvibacter sp. PAE-UM]|uniref:efflux RND transporter periplasmic adaptor subunit n=1 Tax=Curvibacter sp. PAE-UM TaxID=1714344 RepID=UPI00070B38FB|nr:HlyD family efflux transporter periplasmic adaptor subunit [Curvibacter sp. PAE-UM]KRI00693.1 secretion protein HlyD [Curvibacter sp. PAE-UM]